MRASQSKTPVVTRPGNISSRPALPIAFVLPLIKVCPSESFSSILANNVPPRYVRERINPALSLWSFHCDANVPRTSKPPDVASQSPAGLQNQCGSRGKLSICCEEIWGIYDGGWLKVKAMGNCYARGSFPSLLVIVVETSTNKRTISEVSTTFVVPPKRNMAPTAL